MYISNSTKPRSQQSCCDYVIENEIYILFITESWLCSSEAANDVTIRALTPETHSFLHVPRSH